MYTVEFARQILPVSAAVFLASAVCYGFIFLITDGVSPLFDGFHGLFNNGSVDHFTGRGSNILDGLGSNYGCGNGVSVSVMGISGSGIRMTGIS